MYKRQACDCDGNVLDECGVCGGDGIADGACDCDGNVLDECGVCGGDGIADGACDCDGNVLDDCGVCGGDNVIANDLCENAEPIFCGQTLSGTTACSTDEGFPGSCSQDYSTNGNGVWYVFEGVGVPIMLSLDGAYDTHLVLFTGCLLYTSPSPRDRLLSRMPSSA